MPAWEVGALRWVAGRRFGGHGLFPLEHSRRGPGESRRPPNVSAVCVLEFCHQVRRRCITRCGPSSYAHRTRGSNRGRGQSTSLDASRLLDRSSVGRRFSVVREASVQVDRFRRHRACRLALRSPHGRAPVAQRIEHLTTDQKVWGSNPYRRANRQPQVHPPMTCGFAFPWPPHGRRRNRRSRR